MSCPGSPPIWYTMASRNHSRAYRKTVGKTGAEKRGKFRENGSNKRNRKRASYEGYSRAIDILHALYLGEVKYHELSPIFQNFINARQYYGQRIYTREGGIIKELAAEPTFSLKG